MTDDSTTNQGQQQQDQQSQGQPKTPDTGPKFPSKTVDTHPDSLTEGRKENWERRS
jgi:hypothetical protein